MQEAVEQTEGKKKKGGKKSGAQEESWSAERDVERAPLGSCCPLMGKRLGF